MGVKAGTPKGGQDISLVDDCLSKDVIVHELMHAIGFGHEHQRPDRDSYIKINYDNISPSKI